MIRYYVADAFTEKLFGGNPAGVCLLESALDASVMQSIAAENNLAETAFVVKKGKDYDLRWFTPTTEIDLCGHATLASAFILSRFADTSASQFVFHTKSGALTVVKREDLFEMDFPSRPAASLPVAPLMAEALGVPVQEAYKARDLLLLVDTEQQVQALSPDMEKLKLFTDVFAVIVTAKASGDGDFVSRFFAPNAGIPEDPVTGSSHSTLIPFWAERLGKAELLSRQLSQRGGVLYCRHQGERVQMAGRARLYLEGVLHVG